MEHIGLVGYRTDRYIYDSMGLVTPHTVLFKRQYGQQWLYYSLRTFKPDVVLLYRGELSNIADMNQLCNEYLPVAEFGDTVIVFFRKNSRHVIHSSGSEQ